MTEHERIEVPQPDDPWWTVGDIFALTYDAYARIGSSDEVASIANRARDVFDATGEVPTSVETIRTCLFFEQRRWRHFDADPYEDPATKTYLHTLLATLRDLTGGTIEGPIDHPF